MEEAAEYYIDSVLQSVADPAVDGTFVDDIGFGGEHAQMLIDTRLTKQEVAAINNASQTTIEHPALVGVTSLRDLGEVLRVQRECQLLATATTHPGNETSPRGVRSERPALCRGRPGKAIGE